MKISGIFLTVNSVKLIWWNTGLAKDVRKTRGKTYP